MKQFVRMCILIVIVIGIELLLTLYPLPIALQQLASKTHFFYQGEAGTGKSQEQGQGQSFISSQIAQNNIDTIKAENETLRKQLNFSERTKKIPLLAHIIGISTDPTRSLLILDKGSGAGVAKGDPVIVDDGILVGTIFSVEKGKSFLLPLNDPRSSILAAITQHESPIFGIVQGQFNVGLTMGYIPITADIRKGDLILTSGRQEKIPGNLAIGTVDDIRKKSEELFQVAVITPAINMSTRSIVSILTGEVK